MEKGANLQRQQTGWGPQCGLESAFYKPPSELGKGKRNQVSAAPSSRRGKWKARSCSCFRGTGIVWPWKPGGPVLVPDASSAAGVLNYLLLFTISSWSKSHLMKLSATTTKAYLKLNKCPLQSATEKKNKKHLSWLKCTHFYLKRYLIHYVWDFLSLSYV